LQKIAGLVPFALIAPEMRSLPNETDNWPVEPVDPIRALGVINGPSDAAPNPTP